jgi:type I restriction enzyme S subunit
VSVPLKHLVQLNARTLPETTDPDYEFSYLDIGAVGQGVLLDEPARLRFAEAPSRARRSIREGDTIISTVRTYLRATWPVRDQRTALVASTGFAVLTPDPQLEPRYLGWLAQSDIIIDEIVARSVGVSYPAINPLEIGDIRVPLIPMQRQVVVADYLDAETAGIDALVAKKRQLSTVLDERAALRLNELFSTVHTLGPDGTPVRLSGHRMVRLGYLARVQSGITIDEGRAVDASGLTLPYLRVANVQDGRLDLDEVKTVTVPRSMAARSRLQAGDVLMTEGGDPDKLGRGTVWMDEVKSCLHQNHVFAVRPDQNRLLPEYLALVTRTAYARRYFEVTASKTTGIASTSTAKIADFRVPLPSMRDQRIAVEMYVDFQERGSAMRSALERQIGLLGERRAALVTAAVTGELEIPGAAA